MARQGTALGGRCISDRPTGVGRNHSEIEVHKADSSSCAGLRHSVPRMAYGAGEPILADMTAVVLKAACMIGEDVRQVVAFGAQSVGTYTGVSTAV